MNLRLLLLPEADDGTATCLTLDGSGRVLARTQPSAEAPLPSVGEAMRDVLAVPASATRILILAQQAHSQAQARAAARRLFEDDLALDAGDLHVAVSEARPDGSRIAVAAASACMRQWLARAHALGMHPHSVVPDTLLLPPAEGDRWQVAAHDGRWLVRGPGNVFSAEPALAERLVPETARTAMTEPGQVEAWLARGAAHPAVDLCQGTFARTSGSRPDRRAWRRIALAAALVLASPLLLILAGGVRDHFAARALQARAADLVEAALPGRRAGAPTSRTAAMLAELRAGDRAAADLGTLATAVTATADGAIDSLHYDAGQWRIKVSHASPAPPQPLLAALAREGMPAAVLETRPVAGGFRSTLAPAAGDGGDR